MTLDDLLKLAGEQGRVVVVGEDGAVKGVFLPYEHYQKISGGKSYDQQKEDVAEQVNREILNAQLEEVMAPSDVVISHLPQTPVPIPEESVLEFSTNAERIDSLLSKRAQNLFKSIPYDYSVPEVNTASADEEIKPNFDDI